MRDPWDPGPRLADEDSGLSAGRGPAVGTQRSVTLGDTPHRPSLTTARCGTFTEWRLVTVSMGLTGPMEASRRCVATEGCGLGGAAAEGESGVLPRPLVLSVRDTSPSHFAGDALKPREKQ